MLHSNFVIIATLISASGSIAYIIGTLQGKIKPNRVSFFLWSLPPLIAFAAMTSQGVGLPSLLILSLGLLPLLIFIASFTNKDAVWQLNQFDLVCGFIAILGLILWKITAVGNIAIVLSIVADGLSALPTMRKAYYYPETELAWPWLATVIGVVITMLTLKSFTFENSAFLVATFIFNIIIFLLIQLKLGNVHR